MSGTAGVTYGNVRMADEVQYSVYNFELADVDTLWKLFDLHEKEAQRLLALFAGIFTEANDFRCCPRTITC